MVTSLLRMAFLFFYLTTRSLWLSRITKEGIAVVTGLCKRLSTLGWIWSPVPSSRRYWSGRIVACRSSQIIEMFSSSVMLISSASCLLFSLNYYQLLIGNRAKTRSIDSGQSFPESRCWIEYRGNWTLELDLLYTHFFLFILEAALSDESEIDNPLLHAEL